MAKSQSVAPRAAKNWHRKAMALAAQGYGKTAISTRIGIPPSTIQDLLEKPEVRAQVALVREKFADEWAKQVAIQLTRDTPRNLAFLQQVRDGEVEPDAKGEIPAWRDRVTAANRLADSQTPRRHVSTQHISGGVSVEVIPREDALEIQALAEEAGIVLPALTGPDDPQQG